MSHMAKYKAKLGQVNVELLKKALEVVAKELDTSVLKSIDDYAGDSLTSYDGQEIIAAIKTPKIKRGIGVVINGDGILQFVGDSYGYSSEFDKMQTMIEVAYKKVGWFLALQKVFCQTTAKELDNGILLKGVNP